MIRQKVIDNYRDMVASLKTELKLAEAEVERLKKVYAITNESWKKQVEENAQLRKVVDAARDLPCPIWEHSNPVEDKLWDTFITALTELDKEGD